MNLNPTDIRPTLLRPADLQLASPDAHLLTMRSALLDAWDEEIAASSTGCDEAAEAITLRAGAIARQMIEQRACTLAGLQAKAIAVAYCQSGDGEGAIILDDQQTTDVRLAQSILKDLLGQG